MTHNTEPWRRGGERKNTTFSRLNRMHSSGNLDWVLTGLVFYCFSNDQLLCQSWRHTAWFCCLLRLVNISQSFSGRHRNQEKVYWWMSHPTPSDTWTCTEMQWPFCAGENAYNSTQCTGTTIRCLYLCLDHHETSLTASVSSCETPPCTIKDRAPSVKELRP